MDAIHPELVPFGGGVSLRILEMPDRRWRIGDGMQATVPERGVAEKTLVPPAALRARSFDSRAAAINAALAWLTALPGITD